MEYMAEYFELAEKESVEQANLSRYNCFEPDHGRLPYWQVFVCNDAGWLAEMKTPNKALEKAADEQDDDSVDGWRGLKNLCKDCANVHAHSLKRLFHSSSLDMDAKSFCEYIRGH
jgi:hypothetical protein